MRLLVIVLSVVVKTKARKTRIFYFIFISNLNCCCFALRRFRDGDVKRAKRTTWWCYHHSFAYNIRIRWPQSPQHFCPYFFSYIFVFYFRNTRIYENIHIWCYSLVYLKRLTANLIAASKHMTRIHVVKQQWTTNRGDRADRERQRDRQKNNGYIKINDLIWSFWWCCCCSTKLKKINKIDKQLEIKHKIQKKCEQNDWYLRSKSPQSSQSFSPILIYDFSYLLSRPITSIESLSNRRLNSLQRP